MPRTPKYEFTPEQLQALVRRYEEGESLRSIAKTETGGSLICVRRVLIKGGAVIRGRGRPVGTKGLSRRPNKPKVETATPVTPEPKADPVQVMPDLAASRRDW